MIGHRVKCQCGFVFRIGAKGKKQPGALDEINRIRAAKNKAKEEANRPTGSPNQKYPNASLFGNDDVLEAIPIDEPVAESELMDALPIPEDDAIEVLDDSVPQFELTGLTNKLNEPDSGDLESGDNEIVDAIVVDANPDLADQMLFPDDPLDHPLPGASVLENSSLPVTPPRRKKHRKIVRRQKNHLESPAWPIAMLVLCIIAIPSLGFVLYKFLESAHGAFKLMRLVQTGVIPEGSFSSQPTVGFVILGLMVLLLVILCISNLMSLVVSVLEVTKKTRYRWASRITGFVASAVFLWTIVTCGWDVLLTSWAFSEIKATALQRGVSMDESQLGLAIVKQLGWYALIGLTPLALAIVGIYRISRR